MVNIEDFIKRLEILLDYYSLSASSFADKIGVQRSSLSHLLSGRNKPSLDFILKILEVFPEVDLYWILNGKGNFPKTNIGIEQQKNIIVEKETTAPIEETEQQKNPNLFSGAQNDKTIKEIEKTGDINQTVSNTGDSEQVEKIVFFYKNGTFKEFKPNI